MYRMGKFSSEAAYGAGSFTALFGALSLNDWAILVGIICTVGTFIANLYFRKKELEIKQGRKDRDVKNLSLIHI